MKINEIMTIGDKQITWNANSNLTFFRHYGDKSLVLINESKGYFLYYVDHQYIKYFYVTTEKLDFTVYSTSKSLIGKLEVTLTTAFDNWFKVKVSMIKPDYIGKGIGILMYNGAILDCGLTLMSDVTQTPSSQNIWKYFSNHPEKYTVAMFDTHTKEFEPLAYSQKTKQYDDETKKKLFTGYDTVLVVKKV